MPSLNALNEFKSSFHSIANEIEDITANGLHFDDLALPEKEAPPFNYVRGEYSRSNGASANADPYAAADSGDIFGDVAADTDLEGFDFNNFLNDLTGAPSADTEAEAEEAPSDFPPADFQSEDDFMADLLQSGNTEAEEETPSGFPPSDFQSEDDFMADLLQSGNTEAEEEAPSGFQPVDFQSGDDGLDENSIDLGGESQTDEFGSDELPIDEDAGFDAGLEASMDGMQGLVDDSDESVFDDSFASSAGSDADSSADDSANIDLTPDIPGDTTDFVDSGSDFDDNSDFAADSNFAADSGFGLDTQTVDSDFGGDESFDMLNEGGEEFSPDTSFPEEGTSTPDAELPDAGEMEFSSPSETFEDDAGLPDFGDLGSDFSSDTISLDTEFTTDTDGVQDVQDETFDSDDFHIPGLDDIFDKSSSVPKIFASEKKRFSFRRKKQGAGDEAQSVGNVDEIALTQEDLNNLLATLASYPLNLRLACQEIIAEMVILPQQLSKLIKLLTGGASVREAAAFAEEITGKPVVIPKSFEKSSGADFEKEQSSFTYIFTHNFLPVFRLVIVILALAASVFYLSYRFIYIPLRAESIYRRGYERIEAGEFQRANELFNQAFSMHRTRRWFYAYAEAFRDNRRFLLAERKYEELLRHFPRDRRGVLDFAHLQTNYLFNFERANRLLQHELLDFAPNDFDGLLAAGDNFMAWADSDPAGAGEHYENARLAYARLLEVHGWQVPVVERMLKYFIRTDNLGEVIHLRNWFEAHHSRQLSAASLAELGGYLLTKQMETPRGVPSPFLEHIESVRDMLLQAVMLDLYLPEAHYHLARYHNWLRNSREERLTLENAIRAFDLVEKLGKPEPIRRRLYRVDAHYRYAQLLIDSREFFPAEEQLVRGIELFEDFVSRNLIRPSPELGRLYAARGDIDFFAKTGDGTAARDALRHYHRAVRYGHAPPEMLYRMGAAYYQIEDWNNAQAFLFRASADMPLNRRVLFALGNTSYRRGDFFAAQGYFSRLLDILENQRNRLPLLLPNDDPQFIEVGERLMMARNNAGVVYESLAERTGNREFRSRAMALYAESARAWDSISRNPETMTRPRLAEIPGAPNINLGFLNSHHLLRHDPDHTPQIFPRIDRDGVEPSRWEQIAPFGSMN